MMLAMKIAYTMKRFGMIADDKCAICNEIETVEHQLYDCTNAKRVREYGTATNGTRIDTFYDMLSCGTDKKEEDTKAIIIKCLIQIDRSRNLTLESFRRMVGFYKSISTPAVAISNEG